MFEISQLKEKTLVELQEIAKTIGAKKYSQLKKLDLVYLILDIQASNPSKITKKESTTSDNKPKRRRIVKKAVQPKVSKPFISEAPKKEIETKEVAKEEAQFSLL